MHDKHIIFLMNAYQLHNVQVCIHMHNHGIYMYMDTHIYMYLIVRIKEYVLHMKCV